MRLALSGEEAALRDEVRAFVAARLPAWLKRKVELGRRLDRNDYLAWYTPLYERGWITPAWPVEHGGTGWTPTERHIFDEETALAGAPPVIASGIHMLGPVLIAFGSEDQKRRYLPAIRRSETWWAQGFSEPGAGSDLASLRTTAVRDGDDFVVSGHKIWTSYAQWCGMMFCLARTDPAAKPQQGISFLLIDMRSPGVTVRPIATLDGGRDLNEVFLDEVRVPVENLVGAPNQGWTYAKYLLGRERTGIAGIGLAKRQLARVGALAGEQRGAAGATLADDPCFRARVAELDVELLALECTALRMLGAHQSFAVPGAEASMLKVRGTELRQAIHELLLEVAGPHAVPLAAEPATPDADVDSGGSQRLASLAANYLDSRKLSIYGGANEIQRNVIGRTYLAR